MKHSALVFSTLLSFCIFYILPFPAVFYPITLYSTLLNLILLFCTPFFSHSSPYNIMHYINIVCVLLFSTLFHSTLLNSTKVYSNILECCTPVIYSILLFPLITATDGYRDRRHSPTYYEDSEGEEPFRVFVALFDYDPLSMSPNPDGADEELPFKEGQIIKVSLPTNQCPALLPRCLSRQLRAWCFSSPLPCSTSHRCTATRTRTASTEAT